ncbi:MAG TPA: ATP-binding protein [Candidatus Coprenecus avistercoris]|uniref:ATP-binding protein n=1 Tax=Candidatus Coprenecus avistercoris TaxID=2840730 RepID=A0A9D1E2P2_9BACT|nr:ATP-binding protein [Candidatus Coprenecus avistercoris]
MESPFTHNSIATGSDFLSRKKDVSQLVSIIADGRHAVIYEPPRTGKRSLINAALSRYEQNPGYRITHISLLSTIDTEDFSSILEDICSMPASPRPVIYMEEFQNILRLEERDRLIRTLEKEWQRQDGPVFIVSGSKINAMKYIFEEKKHFYRLYERVSLSPIDENLISEHIIKTFLRVGRVVEPSQTEYIYSLTDGHPWYIWQIANSCFNLTKGYLTDSLLEEAIDSLLYTHTPRFQDITDGLSRYQVYLLRAIFDGVTKVSSTAAINNYRLNSSANVHRLKEALTKKEVVVFDAQDIPHIIDPMFRVWLDRFYFKTGKTYKRQNI